MFKLLPRGAYPHAGLQLIEALREYERELERRPSQEERYNHYYRRNRSEFSWHQILNEFCADPLQTHCLHRSNWTEIRPDLYVSTYITERDNFVIDVRPCIDSGFRYSGITHLSDQGDFHRFPIVSAGDRPTNRVLHIGLGEVASCFRFDAPWKNGPYDVAQHSFERRLIMFSTQAKLHQLSLYFDCFIDRELVEFGPERYIDFREPNGTQDPRHNFKSVYSMGDYNYFNPDHWAPPHIKKRLSTANLDVADLYDFAVSYLGKLDKSDQVKTLAEYLVAPPSQPITEADVVDLMRCATDKAYRISSLLSQLATDAAFSSQMKRSRHQFSSFYTTFDLTEQSGLEWVAQYHPEALPDIGYINTDALITFLRSQSNGGGAATEQIDRRIAETFSRDESYKWGSYSQSPTFLDDEAGRRGFPSFDAFLNWAREAAPLTWAAAVERAELVTQHAATRQAEAAARKKAASDKRRATLAAKKAAAAGRIA